MGMSPRSTWGSVMAKEVVKQNAEQLQRERLEKLRGIKPGDFVLVKGEFHEVADSSPVKGGVVDVNLNLQLLAVREPDGIGWVHIHEIDDRIEILGNFA